MSEPQRDPRTLPPLAPSPETLIQERYDRDAKRAEKKQRKRQKQKRQDKNWRHPQQES
jgi:hypothetical protein